MNNGPARKSLIDPERPLSSCGMPRLAGNRVQETPKYELVINLKPRGPIAAQTASVVRTAQLRSRCLSPTISKTRPSGPDIRSTRQLRPAASSRSARIDTVGHSRDRVAKHARCIGLRHGGHLEPAGHRMPERVEAEPITLQPGASSWSRNSSPRRAPILPPLGARRFRPRNNDPSFGKPATYCNKPGGEALKV